MSEITKTLYEKALELDACDKFSGNEDANELIDLFFTPQGLEFCGKNNFPSMEDFGAFSGEPARRQGLYVNAGHISLEDEARVALLLFEYRVVAKSLSGCLVVKWLIDNVLS